MFDIYINGELAGRIAAKDYRDAKAKAQATYGRRVDVIGYKKGVE